MIHDITSQAANNKNRKRLGRGDGTGQGGTAGRGHKGAKSRAGWTYRPTYEGGQMPLFRRLPKRGFSNYRFESRYWVVNIKTLEACFRDGEDVTPAVLVERRAIRDDTRPVKILGQGDLTKKLRVTAARFSQSAKQKIEGAGGSVTETRETTWTRAKAAPGKKEQG